MRKGLIITGVIILAVQSPQRADAGAFATELTQLLNHAPVSYTHLPDELFMDGCNAAPKPVRCYELAVMIVSRNADGNDPFAKGFR